LTVIFALYLPWAISPRSLTFIYHFFPVTPFIIAIIAALFDRNSWDHKHYATWIFGSMSLVLFGMFFPVLNGLMIPKWYIDHALRWFKNWIF
jgi:dolichyl-phosphate-mannose-protein mannosyltransferase